MSYQRIVPDCHGQELKFDIFLNFAGPREVNGGWSNLVPING